jgi:hypothetical protein
MNTVVVATADQDPMRVAGDGAAFTYSHVGASHCSWQLGAGQLFPVAQSQLQFMGSHNTVQLLSAGHMGAEHTVSHMGQLSVMFIPCVGGQLTEHPGDPHCSGSPTLHSTEHTGASHFGTHLASHVGSLHAQLHCGTFSVATETATTNNSRRRRIYNQYWRLRETSLVSGLFLP